MINEEIVRESLKKVIERKTQSLLKVEGNTQTNEELRRNCEQT